MSATNAHEVEGESDYHPKLEDILDAHPSLSPGFTTFIEALNYEARDSKQAMTAYASAIQCFIDHFHEITDIRIQDIVRDHISLLLEKVEELQSSTKPQRQPLTYHSSTIPPIEDGELPPPYEKAVIPQNKLKRNSQGSESPGELTESRLHKTFSGIQQTIVPTIINNSQRVTRVFKRLDVNEFEDTCKMICEGVRTSIQKFSHCQPLSNPQLGDDSIKRHIYRFSTSGKFDSNFGVAYKSTQNFIFIDYAPFIFRAIRAQYHHRDANYILSICGEDSTVSDENKPIHNLKSMLSEGKSSASFLITKDKKYIIKSLKEGEFEFFTSILRDYYDVSLKFVYYFYFQANISILRSNFGILLPENSKIEIFHFKKTKKVCHRSFLYKWSQPINNEYLKFSVIVIGRFANESFISRSTFFGLLSS